LVLPTVAQGLIIPMVDPTHLIAAGRPPVSVVTTPINTARNMAAFEGATNQASLAVELFELQFHGPQLGLPRGWISPTRWST
jgi:hypothetical protein